MNWVSIRKQMTYKEVKSALDEIGIELPEDFCKAIGPINGGALVSAVCNIPGLGDVPYSRNLSLAQTSKGNAIELFLILQSQNKKLFPFGSVGDGDLYCFDLENNEVVLYQHEKDTTIRICKSYTEFMSLISQ